MSTVLRTLGKKVSVMSLAATCMLSVPMAAQAEKFSGFRDYKVTASFIYSLVKHVNWPQKGKAKRRICTVSENPVDAVPALLSKIANNPKYKAPIEVVENIDYNNSATLGKCDLLYVGSFEQAKVGSILNATKNKPIVTVSELRGFAKKGGMVGFVIEDGEDSVLQINQTTMKNTNVVISGRLLQLAELFS